MRIIVRERACLDHSSELGARGTEGPRARRPNHRRHASPTTRTWAGCACRHPARRRSAGRRGVVRIDAERLRRAASGSLDATANSRSVGSGSPAPATAAVSRRGVCVTPTRVSGGRRAWAGVVSPYAGRIRSSPQPRLAARHPVFSVIHRKDEPGELWRACVGWSHSISLGLHHLRRRRLNRDPAAVRRHRAGSPPDTTLVAMAHLTALWPLVAEAPAGDRRLRRGGHPGTH